MLPARTAFRVLVLVLTLLTLSPLHSRATPPASTPGATDGDFASLVDVGGYSLHLTCMGQGSPTVILESGSPMTAEVWSPLMTNLSESNRVCAYDRANVGQSQAAPSPRSAQQMVDDLHALLTTAGVSPPYVLVGYSFGTLVTRLYAIQHPAEVTGLVLIDGWPEDFFDQARPLLTDEQWENRIETAWVGNPEQINIDATFIQLREAGPLPPVPLVVIVHGDPRADPCWMPADWPIEQLEPIWREMQADLARSVPNGRLIVAEGSGHCGIAQELMADAVRDVVAAEDSGALATPPEATPAT